MVWSNVYRPSMIQNIDLIILQSYLGNGANGHDTVNPLFESQNGEDVVTDAMFIESKSSNRYSMVPESLNATSRLSSDIRRGESATNPQDRKIIGERMIRPQSATPSLDERLSVAPPPGLENRGGTPVTSNVAPHDTYLESDRSHLRQLGQRRPASTGVIGERNSPSATLHSLGLPSTSGAVRPAAKTLMALIQEDFSPETPDLYQDEVYFDRQESASPLTPNPDRFYAAKERSVGRESLTESLDRLQISQAQHLHVHNRGSSPSRSPLHVQSSIYNPVAPLPSHQRMQGHDVIYNEQPQFDQSSSYGTHRQSHTHARTQVLPSGHVYLNAPRANPYGYTNVQYPPSTQQHNLLHQTISGPHGEQYINVVPIQGGGTPVQAVSTNGAYAFWQQDGQPGTPTLTIVNAPGPPGIPIAVTHVENAKNDSLHHQNGSLYGGRPKERGGKSRRGGAKRTTNQPSPTHGSSLLEEFKAKKHHKNWSIFQIKGHLAEFCKDQHGSRFVQQRLEVGNIAEKEIVFTEVLPDVSVLRNDVFGNYVVQKLLEFGSPKMKSHLQETLKGDLLQLSLQMYGCRVVQKSFERLDDASLPLLLAEFHNNVLSCIHDQNGNHVIQKCIEVVYEKAKKADMTGDQAKAKFLRDQIAFMVDDVLRNVASLSCHPYGCRVLQRILENGVEPERSRALDEIKKCHKTLLDDQYGNYVIQHVLQFGRNSDRDSILEIVIQNGILKLSKQKFASNVVEKLLKYGSADQRKRVVREMLRVIDTGTEDTVESGMSGPSIALLMVRDAYANYVVQTALDVISECKEKKLLISELSSHVLELVSYLYRRYNLSSQKS